MQIKEYFKGVALAALAPVVKSLSYDTAYRGANTFIVGNPFLFQLNGRTAYNNKIFYSASNLLVSKLVETNIIFSQKSGQKNKSLDNFYSKAITNERRALIKAQNIKEVENHPLQQLFDSPNDYQSGIEMREDFWHNYNFGDGFMYFETAGELSRSKSPIAIHSLNRDSVEVIKSNDLHNPISHYIFTGHNGRSIRIEREQMLHLRRWSPNETDLKGLGVDKIVQRDIALNDANIEAQGANYRNGGRGYLFSSKVEITAEGKAVGKMTKEQITKLQEKVDAEMSGARNNGKKHFVNGEAVITPYGDTVAEMALIDAEPNNWLSVYTAMGIPWSLGPILKAATENNVESGYKALVTNLIVSLLRKFDQKLSEIAHPWFSGIIACHDLTQYSELTPDLKLLSEVFSRDKGPALREDERRSLYSYDELGGELGNAILVPSGLMKLEDLVSSEFDSVPDAKVL